ncbi:unnamed protein product [Blepharisma stoltei]|uniref:Uncharacterized protein n=1 Tax=Blepharisma stoltei TaxID=1481888 RepID=A0AAU9IZ42_9CILI|nr:unnamed protein product [Blepharisma stoltei]
MASKFSIRLDKLKNPKLISLSSSKSTTNLSLTQRRKTHLKTLFEKNEDDSITNTSSGWFRSICTDRIISSRSALNLSNLNSPSSAKESGISTQRFQSESMKTKHELITILKSLNEDEFKPSLKRIRAAYRALELCASEDTLYQKEMKAISAEIYKALFIEKEKISKDAINHIYENHTDCLIDNKDLPLFYVVESLNELYMNAANKNLYLENLATAKAKEFFADIMKKDQDLKDLKEEFENYKLNAKSNNEHIISKLEEEKSRLLNENIRNKGTLDELISKMSDFKDQMYKSKKTIKKLREKEEKFLSTIKSLNATIIMQENHINQLSEENNKMKEMAEVYLGRLSFFNKEKDELEERLRIAEEKNINLSVRAAEGYESLTPRPSFEALNGIMTIKKGPTNEKVKQLIKWIKEHQTFRLKSMRTADDMETLAIPRRRTSVRKRTSAETFSNSSFSPYKLF